MIACERCKKVEFRKLSSEPTIEVPIGSELIRTEPIWVLEEYECIKCRERFTIAKESKREDQ